MALYGPNDPTSGADDATVGTIAWSNPTNIYADDSSWAPAAFLATGLSHYLVATGFGFTVPADKTIVGVKFEVLGFASGTGTIKDGSIKIVKGGVISGDDLVAGTSWSGTPAYYSFGGSGSMWGVALTYADVNAADFGVAFAVQCTAVPTTISGVVDHIRCTVYVADPAKTRMMVIG